MPFVFGLYTGNEYFQFDNPEKFVEFIKDKRVKIYAHNGGKFDYYFLLDWIEPFSEMLVINGRISKFKIGDAEFYDSYSLFPLPLSAYKKDEFDYEKMREENRDNFKDEISKYLKADCVYLYELLQRFFDEYGINITLASAAFKYWQKLESIKRPKSGKKLFDEIHPFYYGGRVQCFEKGIINFPFKVIDINSAYPSAMLHSHPFGTGYSVLENLPENKEEIQRAFIKLKCVAHGCFPKRKEAGGLSFPDSDTPEIFHVTGWEYLSALKNGLISDIEILEVFTFYEKINFKNYVNHFFQRKLNAQKEGDKAGRLMAKLFLNSLYGKFGMNSEHHKKHFIIPTKFLKMFADLNFTVIREIKNDCTIVCCDLTAEEKEQKYINLAVSASITGYVRAYMMDSLASVDHPLYCDTDSIACTGTKNLKISDKLGDWDLEGEFVKGAIAGKKLYAFIAKNGEEKIASKGVKLSSEEIFSIAEGEQVVYQKESPTFGLKKRRTTDSVYVHGESAYIKRRIRKS